MDNRPVSLFLKQFEENARKVFSFLPEDNGDNRSPKENTPIKIKEETSDEIQVKYLFTLPFILFTILSFIIYDLPLTNFTRVINIFYIS